MELMCFSKQPEEKPGPVSFGGSGDEVLPLSLSVLLEDVDHLVSVDDHAVVTPDHMSGVTRCGHRVSEHLLSNELFIQQIDRKVDARCYVFYLC